MSILIKGMKMPKEISSNSHRTITLVIGSDGLVYDVNRNRLPAVAVEVPEPHGRLIDADKLCEYTRNSTVGIDANDICRFPCVIEAEEQEHDSENAKTYSKDYPCYLDYPLREE